MKKLLIYLALGSWIIIQYACNKDLAALPKTALVDGNTIIDAATSQIALNGVYYQFANISAASENTTSWASHEVPPAMLAGYLGYGFGSVPDEQNDNVNAQYISTAWAEAYTVINAANGVISGVQGLSDASFAAGRKAGISGEARFLRAYGHFRVLTYFGLWYDINSPYGALLRDEFTTIKNIQKARSSVKDSYDFILADLDSAISDAPAQNPAYYATKWTAMALKMRVLMSRGGQGDYAAVIDLANNIIQNSPYKLEANVKDIFYTKGLSSNEVMLGVKPQLNQELYHYNLSSQYYPGASALYVAKQHLKDLLQNDPRGAWVVGGPNPYAAYSPNTYYFTKYNAQGNSPTTVSETAYPFRLTEVYLLQAEAIVRSGGNLADARTLVENIMGHAGVTDFSAVENAATSDEMLLQVYYEISRSFVGEDGAEWMALLRLPFATVQQLRPTIVNKAQYVFPIPHAEFVSNPAIGDQNPGYNK